MKKHMVVAVGLALSLAGVASAQQGSQRDERGERPRRERGVEDSTRGQRVDHRRGGPDGLLLKGITLTDGQRAQIAQLNKAQREGLKATRASRQAEMEQVRAARKRGDTAAVRTAIAKNRQAMAQARTERVAVIRNLLTAEQRVQFDQNVAALQQREAKRGQRLGERGMKSGRGLQGR